MKIPKTLDIGGQDFIVSESYIFTERSDIDGRIDFALGKILLGDREGLASGDHVAAIFWHEVAHGISHIYCQNKIGAALEEECIEEVIDALGHGLHQVLKDNFEPLVPKRRKK